MKITGTIASSALTGSSGDVTASRRGPTAYLRTRVTPADPHTEAQLRQRAYHATLTRWWRSVEQQVRDEINRLDAGMKMSGYNDFVGRSLRDFATFTGDPSTWVWPRFMPPNAVVNPVADAITVITHAMYPKAIFVSWSQGEAASNDYAYVLIGEADTEAAIPTELLLASKESARASLGYKALVCPKGNTGYRVFLLIEHVENSTFSIARSAWGVSKA